MEGFNFCLILFPPNKTKNNRKTLIDTIFNHFKTQTNKFNTMTPQELKTVEINTRVFHRKEELILTVVNVVGFTKEGRIYIPCADDKNNIDDYCIDDLILFSGEKTETENIYLNRLKEQYIKAQELWNGRLILKNCYEYDAMRLFCLDTQLISFNDIEVMEYEVNSSF